MTGQLQFCRSLKSGADQLDNNLSLTFESVRELIKKPASEAWAEQRSIRELLSSDQIGLGVLEMIMLSDAPHEIRNAVLKNPNVNDEIISFFAREISQSYDRHKSRDVWSAFSRLHGSELVKSDYPYLEKLTSPPSSTALAMHLFRKGEEIVSDLWYDLASMGLVTLWYWHDEETNGDVLGPFNSKIFEECELESPTLAVLSPGYWSQYWIHIEAPVAYVGQFEAQIINGREEDEILADIWRTNWDDERDEDAEIEAWAFGIGAGHLQLLDKSTYEQRLSGYLAEMTNWLENKVSVGSTRPEISGTRYSALSPNEQRSFASLLSLSQRNYMVSNYRLAEHIGKLLIIHPDTHPSAKEILLSSSIPNLNKIRA